MNCRLRNLGTVNKNLVTIQTGKGIIEIYFSYETPVSFRYVDYTGKNRTNNATRKNDWSTTTGKLLRQCEPDKKARIDGEEFQTRLAKVFLNL